MYAPLQKAWIQQLTLSPFGLERHLKALWLFLACVSLLGWTWACTAIAFFYVLSSQLVLPITLFFSPMRLVWQQGDKSYEGYPQNIQNGFCWVYLELQSQSFTIWQWQMPMKQWRQFRAVSHMWAFQNRST